MFFETEMSDVPPPRLMEEAETQHGSQLAAAASTQERGPSRNRYSAGGKVFFVDAAMVCGNKVIAELFGIHRTCLLRWCQNIDILRDAPPSKKARRAGVLRFPTIEAHVCVDIERQRDMHNVVSLESVIHTATLFLDSDACPSAEKTAKISVSWAWSTLQRGGYTSRALTHSGRHIDHDPTLVEGFHSITRGLCSGIQPCCVLNMDEISVSYEPIPKKTFAARGSSIVSVRSGGKERYTISVALTVTAAGEWLPPYAILRRKTVPRDIRVPDVIISANETSWMTAEEFCKYFDAVVLPFIQQRDPESACLIVDSAPSHVCQTAVTHVSGRVKLSYIPKRHTDVLQPLDLSVMRPFRASLRRSWVNMALNRSRNGKEAKPPKHITVLRWISAAYHSVPPSTILKGWERGGFDYLIPQVPNVAEEEPEETFSAGSNEIVDLQAALSTITFDSDDS